MDVSLLSGLVPGIQTVEQGSAKVVVRFLTPANAMQYARQGPFSVSLDNQTAHKRVEQRQNAATHASVAVVKICMRSHRRRRIQSTQTRT